MNISTATVYCYFDQLDRLWIAVFQRDGQSYKYSKFTRRLDMHYAIVLCGFHLVDESDTHSNYAK